ncbi:hypothetical protein ACWC9U_28680 [Streptomyces sp. 900116325]
MTVDPMDVAMFQETLPSRFRLQLLQVSFPAYNVLFIVLRAPDGRHAAQLSGMAQCYDYLLAAVGPLGVPLASKSMTRVVE